MKTTYKGQVVEGTPEEMKIFLNSGVVTINAWIKKQEQKSDKRNKKWSPSRKLEQKIRMRKWWAKKKSSKKKRGRPRKK